MTGKEKLENRIDIALEEYSYALLDIDIFEILGKRELLRGLCEAYGCFCYEENYLFSNIYTVEDDDCIEVFVDIYIQKEDGFSDRGKSFYYKINFTED